MADLSGFDVKKVIRGFVQAELESIGSMLRGDADRRNRNRNRMYWSGPTRLQRRIMRTFGVTPAQIGLAPGSVLKTMRRRRR